MAPEFCEAHTELVESVGEIKGQQKIILDGLKMIQDGVNCIKKDRADSSKIYALNNLKIGMVFWALTIGTATVLTYLITRACARLWP